MTSDDVMRDTVKHVQRVGLLLMDVTSRLQYRAIMHDASKFSEEEWASFVAATPKLASMTYGSDEYRKTLKTIQPAIKIHYSRNSHHPEHYANGIADMTLLDLMEMLCDWKAASERHNDGDLRHSIEHNAERFGYDHNMKRLLYLTAEYLGWTQSKESKV